VHGLGKEFAMFILDRCGFESEILTSLRHPKKSTSLLHALPGNVEVFGRKHPNGG